MKKNLDAKNLELKGKYSAYDSILSSAKVDLANARLNLKSITLLMRSRKREILF